MKLLWFTNTPSLYKKNIKGYNGGGWIESLEQIVSVQTNIKLAVSFYHSDTCFRCKLGSTTYYPISLYNTKLKKLLHNLRYCRYDNHEVNYYLKVIEDFQPDVIHVFGSEQSFGLISTFTDIPVIIHIQGILNPCKNAFYAPGYSNLDEISSNIFNPKRLFKKLRSLKFVNHNTKRESIILRNCKYFMGRTQWDKDVTSIYAPNSTYFYCSEVLRDPFYKAESWKYRKKEKIIIVSTLSKTFYKGFDLILKTAKILKELTSLDFEWNVFGIREFNEWERKLGARCNDLNINFKGIADSTTLIKDIQQSTVFVHPSYIDNSPNSVCEAQMIGIPVIATNVGGIPSLIENNSTGFLVPANDPYTLAKRILEIKENPDLAIEIGINARQVALQRHDQETIKKDLQNIYQKLYDAKNNH